MSSVVLRTSHAEVCRIRCGRVLQEFAMRWNYVVRQRYRWADDQAAQERHVTRLQRDLRRLGVTTKHLRQLTGIVEVSAPAIESDQFWESRILPWEYILAAATKPHRAEEEILVVRHLKTGRRKRKRMPKSLAVVESAPGELGGHFDFAAQRQLVLGALKELQSEPVVVLENPTARQLGQDVKTVSPDVIHVTGVDNLTGRQRLGHDLSGVRDGLYLADAAVGAREHRAEELSRLFNKGNPNPLLVGLNSWNSAARLAPMTVQAGARSAIGFQHLFDEAVAEIFFLNFYRACMLTRWDLLAAFSNGWAAVSAYRDRIRGSGIVLWSADSLVSAVDSSETQKRTGTVNHIKTGRIRTESADDSITVSRAADPQRDRIRDLVRVTVRPKPQLNYSALHNGESVFDQFTLRINPQRMDHARISVNAGVRGDEHANEISRVDDLELEVQLHVGADSFPFRSHLSLRAQTYRYDLASRVSLPLTGELFRTFSERILTSLFVDLRWHDQVLYRETHPVWLAPIDQWTLDDRQLGWLPSFVQPRDPTVARTIEIAHGYLQCLADQIGVGFDGYQSFDGFASGIDCWSGVDAQVRAIWSALFLGTKLRYINPPPSYSAFTQRLRSPGDTVAGGFGTCVDLAVLLVSCLEWIEIHPVLFFLQGHVFAGYWKDLTAHQRFMDALIHDLPSQSIENQPPVDDETHRWVSGRKSYGEIKGYVDRGELVPIESVAMTSGKGFGAAIDEGREHFYKQHNRSFLAMVDLVSARENDGVTPLPVVFSGQHGG